MSLLVIFFTCSALPENTVSNWIVSVEKLNCNLGSVFILSSSGTHDNVAANDNNTLLYNRQLMNLGIVLSDGVMTSRIK